MAACGTAYMEHSVYPRCTQRAIMEANTMQETALLELRGICKFFPGVRALDGVDFTLRKGEIHALMGENGAGKSTLIKVLTGVYSKDEGTISMEGTPVQIRTTQDALKAGISTVYQEITLCPNLTVAENLYIGRTRGAFTNWRKMNAGAKKILESLGIPAAPTQQLSSCSIAVQQMVAIARAVDMECKVLILDEPTSSLDEQEVEKLFKLMLDLKSRGVGIIFVTHFLEQVYAVCDRITVLRDGKLVGEYKIADLPRVQLVSKMLGKELDDLSEIKSEGAADALEDAQVVYEAAGLSSAAGVRPFDFSIRKGEVNGFTGLLGSGRSESVRAIFGADHVSGGTVKMDGKQVKITSPLRAMKHGISYLPEDRKRDFREMNLGFTAEQARAEAQRCLECGCFDYADCRLIRHANRYELHPERFTGEKRRSASEKKLVCIERNEGKCILCSLCVRTCDEVARQGLLGLVGRGFGTVIKPEYRDSARIAGCADCLKCAEACPTGALKILG